MDPLCGTLNFAAQTPLMAVNVALRTAGDVRTSATVDPIAEEIFWTDGFSACVRRGRLDAPLVPSAESALVDVNLDGPDSDPTRLEAFRLLADPAFYAAFRPRVSSTTLALTWVAAGRRAAYVTDGDLRDSVHFASAIALCQAAGCLVTGLHGRPLHDGVGGLVCAADEETHRVIVDVIRRLAAGVAAG